MPYTYRPTLRCKSGEATALQHLSAPAKQRVIPIIVIPPTPSVKFTTRVGRCWVGVPLALDGWIITNSDGSANTFNDMFTTLGNAGVAVIPSISQQTDPTYLAAVNGVIGQYAPGLLVQVDLNALPQALPWVQANGWPQAETDLVITLGDISRLPFAALQQLVAQELDAHIGANHGWRSVTLSGSSAPQDHGGLATGRNDLPRLEWRLWNNIAPNRRFPLDYGDSGHVHPSLEEPPGFVMSRATVSARYTIDDRWIILKGRPIGGPNGAPMGVQYHGHAQSLTQSGHFGALPTCWADDQIQAIANGGRSAGSRETWVSLSMNRHIEYIAHWLP